MATIRPTYKVEKVVLDLSDLKTKFVLTTNQRKIRTAVVTDLVRQLVAGIHFQSAICVNRVTEKDLIAEFADESNAVETDEGDVLVTHTDISGRKQVDRLFDGGHRFSAMLRYLMNNPSDSIEVTLHVYDNLTPEQEKNEYTLVNKGSKQTTNDVVQQYKNDILAYGWMTNGWTEKGLKREFCVDVSVYGGASSVGFYRIVAAYLASREPTFSGGYMGTAFDFVDDAKALRIDDVRVMNAFMQDFTAAFGSDKQWLKTTPFTALFRIWEENRMKIPSTQMVSLFRSRIARNDQAIALSKSGGFGATKLAYGNFILMLNAGRKRNLFKVDAGSTMMQMLQTMSAGSAGASEED